MTRLVWADCETTGTRPDRGSEIWELALVIRDITPLTGEHETHRATDGEWLWHIRPDLTRADPFALKVGGYYERCRVRALAPGTAKRLTQPEDVEADPAAIEAHHVAHCVANLLSGAHLLAANPAFDAGHLEAFLRQYGECLGTDYHLTDIGSLVRGWALGSFATVDLPWPLKLDRAAQLARINPDDYERHSALDDARLIRDVYDAVAGGAR